MLEVFRGCTEFYGNNTVYITDDHHVQKLEKPNYLIQSPQNNGDEIWITSGVIVALGACCEKVDAIKQLKCVLRQMEAECAEADAIKKSKKVGR
jgi:hypothetical protein